MQRTPEVKKILYCTDLGEHTAPVFMHALGQAKCRDALITILHVVEPISETAQAMISTYISDADLKQVRREGMTKVFNYMKKRIDTFLREETGRTLENEPIEEIKVVSGQPSEEILRIAEEKNFDLIIMGKSSHKIRGNKVMGSACRRVTRYSKKPVLVIPNR